jgi:hypothetical protein
MKNRTFKKLIKKYTAGTKVNVVRVIDATRKNPLNIAVAKTIWEVNPKPGHGAWVKNRMLVKITGSERVFKMAVENGVTMLRSVAPTRLAYAIL